MSLILKFPNLETRTRFLDLVKAQRPELLKLLEESAIFPHLHAHTDGTQDVWLQKRAAGYGKAYRDVQFSTYATG